MSFLKFDHATSSQQWIARRDSLYHLLGTQKIQSSLAVCGLSTLKLKAVLVCPVQCPPLSSFIQRQSSVSCALMKSVHTTTEEAALSFLFDGLCFVVNQRHFRFGAREKIKFSLAVRPSLPPSTIRCVGVGWSKRILHLKYSF